MKNTVKFKPVKVYKKKFMNSDFEFEEVEFVDTKKQQLASLELFADCIGYQRVWTWDGASFRDLVRYKPKNIKVSFNTMVKWHNTGFMPHWHHGLEKELPNQAERLGLDVASMMSAINARLYQQVFLHGRRDKTVSCYKHILRFA